MCTKAGVWTPALWFQGPVLLSYVAKCPLVSRAFLILATTWPHLALLPSTDVNRSLVKEVNAPFPLRAFPSAFNLCILKSWNGVFLEYSYCRPQGQTIKWQLCPNRRASLWPEEVAVSWHGPRAQRSCCQLNTTYTSAEPPGDMWLMNSRDMYNSWGMS